MGQLTLAKAKEILPKYTTEDHLFTHAAAVSAAMGAMAAIYGGDKDHWEAIGYLHDVDYEKYPNEHCHHVREFLAPKVSMRMISRQSFLMDMDYARMKSFRRLTLKKSLYGR